MQKTLVILGALLVSVIPWISGGRDATAVLLTVFGLILVAWLYRRPNQPASSGVLLRVLTFLWLGWGALSLIWSVNRFQTEMWLLYALIGVLVFTCSARLSANEKGLLLRGYVWIAVVAALYGLYLYLTGDYNRLTSSFYWANPAAAYLLPATTMAGCEFARHRRWVDGLQVGILGVAFWLTDSRGAILAAAIAMLVALLFHRVRRYIPTVLAVIVISFGVAAGLAQLRSQVLHHQASTPGGRFTEAARGESTSVQDRWNYLKSSFEIWHDHPLLGTGAGTYGTVHPQYQLRVISAANDAHNFYVQTLAEQGLIGALILAYLMILLLFGVFRGMRREPRFGVAGIALVALLLHFGLDIDDRYPALIGLAAMLAGVSYQPWVAWPVRGVRQLAPSLLLVPAVVIAISAYLSAVQVNHGRIYDDDQKLDLAAASYASAHRGPVYDPDTWTAEGIDDYTIAAITGGSKTYAPLARDRAEQAIKRDPKDSQHYQLLGRVDRLDGKPAAAEADFRQALKLDPYNHPDYYVDLASALLQQGKAAEAARTVADGLSRYPDEVISNRSTDPSIKPAIANLWVLRALEQSASGHNAYAKQSLNKALKLDPNNQDAKNIKSQLTS